MYRVLLPALLVGILFWACDEAEGPTLTNSGYHYIIHTAASGPKPDSSDYVLYHMYLRSAAGPIYTTRDSRPVQARLSGALEKARDGRPEEFGFLEVLPHLGIGDSATVLIPVGHLAPEQRAPVIGDADTLYFDVAIKNIRSEADIAQFQEERKERNNAAIRRAGISLQALQEFQTTYQEQGLAMGLDSTDSGIQYRHIRVGEGPRARNGMETEIYFIAALATDGTILDNGVVEGQPLVLPLGYNRAFPGLEEGIKLMREGGSSIFVLPSRLSHADRKPDLIPKGAEMIYYVDLVRVEQVE